MIEYLIKQWEITERCYQDILKNLWGCNEQINR